jgi:hypothetical protein
MTDFDEHFSCEKNWPEIPMVDKANIDQDLLFPIINATNIRKFNFTISSSYHLPTDWAKFSHRAHIRWLGTAEFRK